MSLEIREMVVKTTLSGDPPQNGEEKQQSGAAASAANTQAIVAECMQQLKEWLREQKER